MRRNLFVAFLLLLGFGLTLSSCAPGVYTSTSVGVGPGYYGPGYYRPYYGPRYYAPAPVIVQPRPIIVQPRPRVYGGFRGDAGWRGGGPRGGYGGGYYGGPRRGGR